jgi:hypothetical protein
MFDQVRDTEQHLSKLQAQLDRLSLSLQQWQQTQEHLQPMERRMSHLLQQGGQILDRLTATDERHAQAIGDVESRLSSWGTIETHFRERAKSFDDICAAAASLVSGIERAESRLSALEAEMHARLNQLSSDVQGVVAHLRGSTEPRPNSLTEGAEAWPLERVMRLHEQLRQSEAPQSLPLVRDDSAALLTGRVESLELALTLGKEEMTQVADRSAQQRRRSSVAFVVLALGVVAAGALAIGLHRRIDNRLTEAAASVVAAQRRAEAATEHANQQIASTREDADRRIAEAQQTARQAQIVSDVLAAPDLVRFNLTGTARAPRSYGQLLWSRSRGLVFTGARVPAAPATMTNQLWLLTTAQPVSVGVFVPDSKGRVALITDDPPTAPRRVIGAALTLEPTGNRAKPSGAATVQSRALVVTPPPPEP